MTNAPCSVNTSKCDNSDIYVHDVISTAGLSAALAYFCMVFLLSLLCNGTICVVFYKRPNLLTVSNSLVLNLTCCELGLSILIMPFWVMSLVSRKWVMSDVWCRIQAYLLTVLLVALQYSLLIIAVDRNYAIINSLRYPYIFSPRLGNILIAITWILGLAIGMPPLFTYGEFTYHRTQFVCAITWESQSKYGVFIVFAAFLLPFIVQTCCYVSIFRAAIKHTKSANRVYPSVVSTSTAHDISIVTSIDIDDVTSRVSVPRFKRKECKAVKTILIIYGSYIASWTCYVTTGLMKSFGSQVSDSADMAGICLVFLSCAVNPVIYGFMNRLTRNETMKFFFRASQRITGRDSVLIESEDYYSSTHTTNFSSGRHNSGSYIPVTRGRSNSIKVGCPRAADMMTIQEVSETEDENIKSNSTLKESSYVHNPSKNSRLCKSDTGEVILRPANLRQMTLKRWHSNDDIIRNLRGNVNGNKVTTVRKHYIKSGASGKTRTKLLLRSQSVAGGLARTTLHGSRMSTVNVKSSRTPLSIADIL